MRINKYLADAGIASRREADRLIEAGKVTIDGRRARPGDNVGDGMTVKLDGRAVRPVRTKTVIAFHKPVGIIVTTDPASPGNVMEALREAPKPLPKARLVPVGRLDVASSGLLIMTDDTALAERLMRPGSRVEKEYDVVVDRPIPDAALERLAKGVRLENMPAPRRVVTTRPARVTRTGERSFRIAITEGKNRQIRRMCEAVGCEVRKLVRVRVGGVELGDLPEGEWRPLAAGEIDSLRGV